MSRRAPPLAVSPALVLALATACAGAAPSVMPARAGPPLAVTHRAAADDTFPENTLEALRHALRGGSTAVEVDVSFTRDGELVLWHDEDPRSAGATARRLGAAPGPYRPLVPVDARRPLPELRWAEARLALGYARTRGDGRRLPFAVPRLAEALAVARAEPAVRLVVLDLKSAPATATGAAYAPALRRALDASGLEPARLLLLHRDPEVVRHLRRALGDAWPLAHDVGGPGLWHCPRSALASARALGTPVVSLARPPFGLGAWAAFVASVRADRAGIEAEVRAGLPRRRLLVWTLDREDELREAIGLGVDLIVTDQPRRLEALLAPVDAP